MTIDELAEKLAGVVAITVTPFQDNGSVDEVAYTGLVDRLITGGIPVVTANGNTSEFYALSEVEARQAVDLTVRTTNDRAAVLCGVGHDLNTAIVSAQYATRAGADGVMVHQPVHPYVALDGWVDYHRAIADAVPDSAVVLYIRDPRIDGAQLGRLADSCPNVVGVKYAVRDPVRFASVARDAGIDRFVWVAGLAELYAPGYWAVGARGFTSGLANVSPEISLQLFKALSVGEYGAAMVLWEVIRPFEELRAEDESAHNVSVVKEALAQLGLCRGDVRPPSRPLGTDKQEQVRDILTSWGLRG